MNDIINIIRGMPDFIGGKGESEIDIENAEKILSLFFAKDFHTYLLEIGLACFDGHELTGICAYPRLNVVDVTLNERAKNPDIPKEWYVIELANIDGIVIWQNQQGEVYQTQPNYECIKIAHSIAEYLTNK